MDDSRKSLESESSDSLTSCLSSDEDQLPAKKPFLSYHDQDESASSVCPPLSIASSEGTTVLRRSLRKVIEESKRDAASSSVSNSRESTPPRMSSSKRQVSSRWAFSPSSRSRPGSSSKKNDGGVVSSEVTRSAKRLDFQQRSARAWRTRRVVDDSIAKSLPDGAAPSSDDDASSVKESRNGMSGRKRLTKNSNLATPVDTSDTDSRASSLCAYSTQSTASGQTYTVKSTSRSTASVRPKTGRRSGRFTRARNKLCSMQSSDSETDSQTNALRTSFFDSFPDNSSSGSSIANSVHNAELSMDRYIDNCKYGVTSSSEAIETPSVKVDLDEAELKNSAEFDVDKEKHRMSKLSAESSVTVSKKSVLEDVPEIKTCLENKDARYQNENGETDESNDGTSDVLMRKGQLSGENGVAATVTEGNVTETEEEEKDALSKINCNNSEAAEEDMKVKENAETDKEAGVADQTEDEEAKIGGCSKPASNDGNKDEQLNEKCKEEDDEMLNVKEEPPEILVNLTNILDGFILTLKLIFKLSFRLSLV